MHSTRLALRVFAPLIVVGVACGVVLGAADAAFADTTTVGNFTYSVDPANVSAGATVTDYSGPVGSLTVPPNVSYLGDTYAVTAIGEDGGGNGAFETKGITSVSLPDSLITIESNAFSHNALASVTIPDNVTSLGISAFSNMATLTSVTLGSSVQNVGINAFAADGITTLSIPNSVTTIQLEAFAQNPLTALTLGDAVTTIGAQAFIDDELTTVTIPASVTEIDQSAFDSNQLTSVHFVGAPPTAGLTIFGSGTPTIYFPVRFEAPGFAGGYTVPTWSPDGGSDQYPSAAVATVTFDGNGGSSPAAEDVVVGSSAAKPADPTRSGYAFAGWATASAGGTTFDFASTVSTDTTLYAQWTALAETGLSVSPWVPIGACALVFAGLVLLLTRRILSARRSH